MYIDIIIPTLNDLRVKRTFKSIKKNSLYNKLKLIIVDGGSCDDYIKLLKSNLRDQDTLISESDNGIFDALNKGILNSSSEIVYWLGSDDFINPGFDFQNVIDCFKNDNDLALLSYKTIYFKNSKITRKIEFNNPSISKYIYGNHFPHFSTFVKGNLCRKLNFNIEYKIASDYDFFFYFLKNNFKCLSFPNTLVYVEEGGNSNYLPNNLIELFKILKKHTNLIIAIIGITLRYFSKIFSKIFYNSKKDELIFKSILLDIQNEK
tara:strand:- start:4637 stop:5425 length:789 start_codon:yes stop_codon:yes gene_type:complete